MKLILMGLLVFCLFVWAPVESAWADFCFNNYDLGIYAQAIQLLSLDNPNPWLSVRDVYLFNDHFDPVLFLLVPFKNLMSASLLAIRFEMLSLLVAAVAPFWLARKNMISFSLAVLSAAIILFSPLTLDAAFFPAHPGTWSLAPLSWMFAFLIAGHHSGAVVALLLTMACKEEYPFVGLAIGSVLWLRGQRKFSFIFLAISVLWAMGVFLLRPALLGPASMYTDAVSQGQGLQLLLSWDGFAPVAKRLVELCFPLLPMLLFRDRQGSLRDSLIPLGVLLVLIGIRVAGGYWGNHRSAPLAVTGAYILIFVLRQSPVSSTRQWLSVAFLFVLAVPRFELGSRVWRGKAFKKHCPPRVERVESLRAAEKTLRERNDGTVLAQGNLIPRLVDLPGIAHLGSTHGKSFRYLLVEKGVYLNTWPATREDFMVVERSWLNSSNVKKLIDNEHVLLLEKINSALDQ